MDYLQYLRKLRGEGFLAEVLNLIINGLPSIHVKKWHLIL